MRSDAWKWPLADIADPLKLRKYAEDTAEVVFAEELFGIADEENFLSAYLRLLEVLGNWSKLPEELQHTVRELIASGESSLDASGKNAELFDGATRIFHHLTNFARTEKKSVYQKCQSHLLNWKIAFAEGGQMLAAAIRADAVLWREHGPMSVADATAILPRKNCSRPKDFWEMLRWYLETIRVKYRQDFKLQADGSGIGDTGRGGLIPAGGYTSLFDGITMWQGKAVDGLKAPIGWTQDGQRVCFKLDTDEEDGKAIHALVGGATGSGKSVLVHDIIHSLAHAYGPDELDVLYFDCKEGVGLGAYVTEGGKFWLPHIANARHGLPHVPDTIAFRETLEAVIAREKARLGNAGVANIRQYNAQGGKMKRKLIVVEDFQELFFRSSDHGARTLMTLLSALMLGRTLGLHLVLTTQTMAWSRDLLGGTVNECLPWFGLRLALPGTGAEGILAGDNQRAVREIRPRQQAISNPKSGESGANTVFLFPFVSHDSEGDKAYRRRMEDKVGGQWD